MKSLFKRLCILSILVMFTILLKAQTIEYTYDQAGNRTGRIVIPLTSQPSKKHTYQTDSVIVKDKLGEREVKIYPNPTRGALGVEIYGGNSTDALTLMLYNGQGKLLYSANAAEGLNSLDMSAYPSGWYILQFQSGVIKKEYKIIKE